MDMKDEKKKTRARSKDKEKVNKKENYKADKKHLDNDEKGEGKGGQDEKHLKSKHYKTDFAKNCKKADCNFLL